MNITILGMGAYAIALSKRFLQNGCQITMWTKVKEEYDEITKTRINNKVLPNYKLDETIELTMDLKKAISNANLIVIALPVKFIRNTVTEMKEYYNNQNICLACKGMEQNNYLFPHVIVSRILQTKKVAIISGGTFAIDMIKDIPIALTVASKNNKTIKIIKKYLENKSLKLEITKDIFGVEFWGSIKNVIAIGCGITEGMNLPESTRCMFFTKCFNDITNMVYKLGGNKKSANTFAGIGDLFLTCTSRKSRNYTYGVMLGKREDTKDFISNTTIEGLYTLKAFYEMLKKKKEKLDIINIIYMIAYENGNPEIILNYLEK